MIYGVNAITSDTTATAVQSSNAVSDFSSYLGESQSLDSIFQKAADTYQVPVNLLKAIGKQESNFDANAVSRCGAQGIMQLMPATATSLGVTNSFDAEQNIMGGAKYIAELLDKYDGNVSYALAAYNAGSNNVAKYGGIPPFKETQDYVVKVTNYMNQGVEVPNVTLASSSQTVATPQVVEQTSSETTNTEAFSFSYEDYLEFLLLFEKIISSEPEENENAKEKTQQSDSLYSLYENSKLPSLALAQMLDI